MYETVAMIVLALFINELIRKYNHGRKRRYCVRTMNWLADNYGSVHSLHWEMIFIKHFTMVFRLQEMDGNVQRYAYYYVTSVFIPIVEYKSGKKVDAQRLIQLVTP